MDRAAAPRGGLVSPVSWSVKTDGLGKAVSTTAAAVTGEPATDSLDGALADPAGSGESVKLLAQQDIMGSTARKDASAKMLIPVTTRQGFASVREAGGARDATNHACPVTMERTVARDVSACLALPATMSPESVAVLPGSLATVVKRVVLQAPMDRIATRCASAQE